MIKNKEKWKKVITAYIDSLRIESAQKLRNDLVTHKLKCTFENLNIDSFDDKSHIKKLKAVRNMKIDFNKSKPEKEIEKIQLLKSAYQAFKVLGYVSSIDDETSVLEAKTDLYNLWVNLALIRVNYVTNATHVAKLSHSGSSGVSIIDNVQSTKSGYITTSCLDETIYDGAYPNGDLSKVVKFLLLQVDNDTLADLLRVGNIEPLSHFASTNELVYWQKEFKKRLNPKPKADALAKQVYFPVDDDYHLLIVMKSSSLIQKIYENYFDKEIRKQRDKCYKLVDTEKYSPDVFERIPNVTTLATVMSQPQNVSVLHGSRGGNIRLFSCAPPNWQAQLKPPIHRRSLFHDNKLNSMAYESISNLKYMLVTSDIANISFKEPNRYRGIANGVLAIAELVMDYAQIMLSLPPNWTSEANCKLPLHHQYFLDAYRSDDKFIQAKYKADWQLELTDDFVAWLNGRLAGKQKDFLARKEHSRVWRRIFAEVLRLYQEDIEAMYSKDKGVTV